MRTAGPVLVGYALQSTLRRGPAADPAAPAPFPAPLPVDAICSVSSCLSRRPVRWTRHYRANEWGLLASPAAAWASVWVRDRPRFGLFAYRVFPTRFADGSEANLVLPVPAVEALPSGFARLGYDAVEITEGFSFGCSPLSCNGQAGLAGVPRVNRFCLVNTRRAAVALARRFAVSKPEPGPYVVVEVWGGAQASGSA